MLASERGHLEAVDYLSSLPDVDLDIQDESRRQSALHYAIGNDHLEVVQLLCNRGADLGENVKMVGGLTAFMLGCATGDRNIVQCLYDAHQQRRRLMEADCSVVNMKDNEGHTALMIALSRLQNLPNSTSDDNGVREVVEFLLEKDVEINAQSISSGCSALMLLCDSYKGLVTSSFLAIMEMMLKVKTLQLHSQDQVTHNSRHDLLVVSH